jgi:hypothetical protein
MPMEGSRQSTTLSMATTFKVDDSQGVRRKQPAVKFKVLSSYKNDIYGLTFSIVFEVQKR